MLFNLDGGRLIPEEPYYEPYITVSDEYGDHNFAWDKIPLVPFKINETEVPLICACKSLQDGLNKLESQWEDQMEENPRNTILVLVNYDGENLGEFRKNLANYGAVKVRSYDRKMHSTIMLPTLTRNQVALTKSRMKLRKRYGSRYMNISYLKLSI